MKEKMATLCWVHRRLTDNSAPLRLHHHYISFHKLKYCLEEKVDSRQGSYPLIMSRRPKAGVKKEKSHLGI